MATRATRIDLASPSGRPLYLQLVDWLRADVAGQKPGAWVESEPKLARRFGVSRFTVTRAIEILVDEGLLTRRQGLGTFVAPPRLRRAPTYLTSFTEAMKAQGRATVQRLLGFGPIVGAKDRLAYPYPEGSSLVRLDRLRLVDGLPAAIHHSVIDADVARRIGLTKSAASKPNFSLYRLFRDAGLATDRGVETLQARLATAQETRLLALDKPAVVMTVRRETYSAEGMLLDVDDAVHDARRYAYETEIRSGGALDAPFVSKSTETANASNSNDKRSVGPRFGPWRDNGSRR